MKETKPINEWQSIEHAFTYLTRADKLPHRVEGEKVLLDQIPRHTKRVLDLGTGDGRLMGLIKLRLPDIEGVALDFSEPMLEQARKRFKDSTVRIFRHDFSNPLPANELGHFDLIVSSLAIHHLTHPRKKQLYDEIFNLLNSGGVFCNFEHVSSSTEKLHLKFISQIGQTLQTEDPSNKLLDVETQLSWFREIGFIDVDCYWKWFEIALLVGFKP